MRGAMKGINKVMVSKRRAVPAEKSSFRDRVLNIRNKFL